MLECLYACAAYGPRFETLTIPHCAPFPPYLYCSFHATLPLQQLHKLRRLTLENVKLLPSNRPSNQTAHLAAAAPNGNNTTCSHNQTLDVNVGVDGATCSSHSSSLAHITHLHTDSSFESLVCALKGQLQLLGALEVLKITLGPRDSEFVGSYLTRHGDRAFQALCEQCGRLQKLLLGTAHVTSDCLKQVGGCVGGRGCGV